jgi:hypothetical protein
MGAEINWTCQGGGNYVFELIFYRDCNGFDVNTISETIRVWGHPSVSSIAVAFIERIDISPSCTPAGGATALLCGSGANAGNGAGATEKVIYRSAPIALPGTPGSAGWFFTYESAFRNGNITNLVNASTLGMTISAGMFSPSGQTSGCLDNSPRFLQDPYVVSCAGLDYVYNPHAVDPDLDSLVFLWDTPLNWFPSGTFNPPVNPAPVPFEAGFGFSNPTPNATFNPGNLAASINAQNGNLTFRSFTQGNFVTKIRVNSYRNGNLIAYVEREIQLVVLGCDANNNAPVITPPFGGGTSFETTIMAGDLVNFNLASTDVETLQNGAPQSNTITASSLMFGNNFTDPNNGCVVGPCATLNPAPPITGVQGAIVNFNWQTSCDHLVDASGNAQSSVPYIFVFKVADDYCPVPKVTYATVIIHVQNQGVLPAPAIECIQTDENNNVTINWSPVSDPNGDFAGYSIIEAGVGEIATVANINTTSFTIAGAGVTAQPYTIATRSGCGGNTLSYSDTIRNIHLNLNNPGTGEAILNWNRPRNPPLPYYGDYFHIYKEYPMGVWNLIDSVPYNTTNYRDTIYVCQAFINYRIVLPTTACDFISNIRGDVFEDNLTPSQPIIQSVNIDTLTGGVTIIWNENNQPDTYGYVIYTMDGNGFLVEMDTLWGIGNTSYTYFPNTGLGPLTYSVAAFDSCFTDIVPPTYQTSAKAELHTTNFLTGNLDICARRINLDWTGYIGFSSLAPYQVWLRENGGVWQLHGTSPMMQYSFDAVIGNTYEVVIRANDANNPNRFSFSNRVLVNVSAAAGPTFSYISKATVLDNQIQVHHRFSQDGGVNRIRLERFEPLLGNFVEIDELLADAQDLVFIDNDAEPNRRSYRYRTLSVDTCDIVVNTSNIGETIFLTSVTDETAMVHVLQWSAYREFAGNVAEYRVYRGIDGVFSPTPIAFTSPQLRSVVDSVYNLMDYTGKICYYVEAVEGPNVYGASEVARSNEVCPVLPPIIYVPNAFTLGGMNPIFKPVTSLRKIDDYQFEIYDRYGRIIFSTNDINEGWDGRIEAANRYAREGMYVWRLSLRDGNGIEVLRHGHVTLLDYR